MYGRLDVDEVGDRFERDVELGVREPVARGLRGGENGAPRIDAIEPFEDGLGSICEGVGQVGGELRARSLARHGNGCLGAACAVEDLDHVGQVDELRSDEDVVALRAVGHAAAVPALEALFDRLAYELAEPDPLHQIVGGAPVVVEHRLGRAPSIAEE